MSNFGRRMPANACFHLLVSAALNKVGFFSLSWDSVQILGNMLW